MPKVVPEIDILLGLAWCMSKRWRCFLRPTMACLEPRRRIFVVTMVGGDRVSDMKRGRRGLYTPSPRSVEVGESVDRGS